jgi:hypothetical protein
MISKSSARVLRHRLQLDILHYCPNEPAYTSNGGEAVEAQLNMHGNLYKVTKAGYSYTTRSSFEVLAEINIPIGI